MTYTTDLEYFRVVHSQLSHDGIQLLVYHLATSKQRYTCSSWLLCLLTAYWII